MKTYSIAVIGVGKIAEDQHLPVIAKTARFHLAGLVDQRDIARPSIPNLPSVPSFKTVDEMLSALPDLDAVAICTPPRARHAIARQLLDAGKHILLEKPTTTTTAEFSDLVGRAAQKQRVIFTTWHSQFNAAVDTTRKLLRDKRITSLRVEWKEDVRRWHPGQDWVWQAGGFGVFDPGINALSIVTRILPEPIFVQAADLTFPDNRETPIAASLRFATLNGDGAENLKAEFDWRQTGPQSWNITVGTDEGKVLALTDGGSKLAVDGQPVVTQPMAEYEAIYQRFAEMLDSGESEIDATPLNLVADAFLMGRRLATEDFDW